MTDKRKFCLTPVKSSKTHKHRENMAQVIRKSSCDWKTAIKREVYKAAAIKCTNKWVVFAEDKLALLEVLVFIHESYVSQYALEESRENAMNSISLATKKSMLFYIWLACDHVGYKISVARRIQKSDSMVFSLKICRGNIYCDSPSTLLRPFIQQPGPGKTRLAHLRRISLMLMNRFLTNNTAHKLFSSLALQNRWPFFGAYKATSWLRIHHIKLSRYLHSMSCGLCLVLMNLFWLRLHGSYSHHLRSIMVWTRLPLRGQESHMIVALRAKHLQVACCWWMGARFCTFSW